MSAANLDHTDANEALAAPGVIRESVMDKIWQIDKFPLPLTDMCSKGTHGNQKIEYTTDEFADPSANNKVTDGADIEQDDSKVGERVANYTQTSVKEVQVSTRANAADSIGRQATLSYQVSQRQKELRRDVEMQMCSDRESIAGDANADVAGQSAGLGAWIKTNTVGGAGYVAGGFNPATGLIATPTVGAPVVLSETMIKDIMQAIFQEGGEGKWLMARPEVIRIISEFYFTDTAKAATMVNDNASGTSKLTAYSSTNVIVTDFGTLSLLPNRLQGETGATSSNAFILDSAHLKQSFMTGYRVEPLGKTGLSEKRLMSVDYSLCVLNEKSQGLIHNVDHTAAMVA